MDRRARARPGLEPERRPGRVVHRRTARSATCTVDASGSSDTAPGTVASYAWNFGDGGTGTGVTTTHTYTTSGAKTITLTVTDNQGLASAPTTRTANPTVAAARPATVARATPTWCRTSRAPTRRAISNGEIWDIEVVAAARTGSSSPAASPRSRTPSPRRRRSTRPTWRQLQPQHRPDRHRVPPDVQRRRRGRGRGHARTAPSCSSAARFNTVNGVAKQKVASLNLTTGAPLTTFGFTNSTNNQVTALAATNSTLYVGGRFTRINGVAQDRPRRGEHRVGRGRHDLRQRALRRHRRQRRARRAAAQADPRREQAARRAHRPADRRPGPLGMGIIDTAHQAAAALAQHRCGTTTSAASAASPASTAATSRPTTPTSS